MFQLTLMESELLRYLIRTAVARYRAKRYCKTSGISTKTPTPAPSTISSSACAATSNENPPSLVIC